jgi:pimeloyl-ACP methyl ester carboxylesterase
LTATKSADVAFVIAVSAVGMPPAKQMNYSAEYELREKGFPDEAIGQMLVLHVLGNEYYRGKADLYQAQDQLDSFRDEAWFPFAYLDEDLPQDPTVEKWHQEMGFDPLPVIQKVNVPTLLLYGEQDPWVPIAKSMAVWKEHGPNDLSIHQIKDANHFMISISHAGIYGDEGPQAEEYSTVLTKWLKPRLG